LIHLFFIHSNIVEIVAYLTVKYLNIKNENIFVIKDRGHSLKLLNPQSSIEIDSSILNTQLKGSYSTYKNAVKKIDQLINSQIKHAKYACYVPQTSYEVIKVIISNSNCISYSYLEEGIGSYQHHTSWQKSYESMMNSIKKRPGYVIESMSRKFLFSRLDNINIKHDFYNQKYRQCFALDKRCFDAAPGHILLHFDKILMQNHPSMNAYTLIPNVPVLVTDCYYQYSKSNLRQVEIAFKNILNFFIENNIYNLLIKFHPKENLNSPVRIMYETVIKEFNSEKNTFIKKIDDNISIELLSITNNNDFYYIYSSLGLYVRKMGAKAYCMVNVIAEADEEIAKYYNKNYKSLFENPDTENPTN
jgi:hypothetical protein